LIFDGSSEFSLFLLKKNVDIKISVHNAFLENLHEVRSKPTDWKAKQFKGVWEQ
jgi:hypothetical protein